LSLSGLPRDRAVLALAPNPLICIDTLKSTFSVSIISRVSPITGIGIGELLDNIKLNCIEAPGPRFMFIVGIVAVRPLPSCVMNESPPNILESAVCPPGLWSTGVVG